ncbi:asparagine N-glycosylation enzyme membrane subunit Stt3 [Ottowia thiooxydans]|uniref:Asparagine N-glycosylation enzyme membrane subunit Stt3 n=1 Tax=Ottowia thiooxydans TaxID=219182 RepID=A0ABV2QGZ9_9BURK
MCLFFKPAIFAFLAILVVYYLGAATVTSAGRSTRSAMR